MLIHNSWALSCSNTITITITVHQFIISISLVPIYRIAPIFSPDWRFKKFRGNSFRGPRIPLASIRCSRISRSLIFEVRCQSVKNAKIMRLKNYAPQKLCTSKIMRLKNYAPQKLCASKIMRLKNLHCMMLIW